MVALRAVCVFCGSSAPADPRYTDAARGLGILLARRGVALVPAQPEKWISAEER